MWLFLSFPQKRCCSFIITGPLGYSHPQANVELFTQGDLNDHHKIPPLMYELESMHDVCIFGGRWALNEAKATASL